MAASHRAGSRALSLTGASLNKQISITVARAVQNGAARAVRAIGSSSGTEPLPSPTKTPLPATTMICCQWPRQDAVSRAVGCRRLVKTPRRSALVRCVPCCMQRRPLSPRREQGGKKGACQRGVAAAPSPVRCLRRGQVTPRCGLHRLLIYFNGLCESEVMVNAPLAKTATPLQERASGEMAEWLKAHAWKACVRETVPWVRIPLSPPLHCSPLYPIVRIDSKNNE